MFQVATVTRPGGGRLGVQLGGRSGTNAGTFFPLEFWNRPSAHDEIYYYGTCGDTKDVERI